MVRSSPNAPLKDRILKNVVIDPETGCWNWQLHVQKDGYGRIKLNRRTITAQRAAYEAFKGPLAKGMDPDHLCRNRRCANPGHLEAVSKRENVLRGVSPVAKNAAKTECKRGHPFDELNTYMGRTGHRACRACGNAAQRAYKARKALR